MRVRQRAALLLAACLCAPAASARAEKGPGTTGADFLRIAVGPRAVGLGETYTGMAEGPLALAYNPAGLGFMRRSELTLAHNEYADGMRHEWAGFAHPTPWGTLAGSANLLLTEPFASYDDFDRPSGETSAHDACYQLAYAAPLAQTFAIAGAYKLITSRLHDRSARTLAADAGLMWRPVPGLSMGAAALHLGPGLRHLSETADLPATLRAGFAWTPISPKDFKHYLTMALDAVKVREDGVAVHGGLELWYARQLALRLGGRSDADSGPGYSLGTGLRLYHDDRSPVEIDFDYAFTDSGNFAQSHRAGLTLRFGKPLTDSAWSEFFRRERRYHQDAPKPSRRARREPDAKKEEPAPRPPDEALPRALPSDLENWIKP